METYNAGAFNFSAVRPEDLEATEYTLATIILDTSGSMSGFEQALQDMLDVVVKACQKSPKSDCIMLRVLTFDSDVTELVGFIPVNQYPTVPSITTQGMTALYDAIGSGMSATLKYAKDLRNSDFDVNGAIYVMTDGGENNSSAIRTEAKVKELFENSIIHEDLDSLARVFVAFSGVSSDLANKLGMDFIDMGDVTVNSIGKLGKIFSQSISSQSQSIGSGQSAPLTI